MLVLSTLFLTLYTNNLNNWEGASSKQLNFSKLSDADGVQRQWQATLSKTNSSSCLYIASLHAKEPTQHEKSPVGNYVAKDFSHLLGMPGFTNDLLKNHFTLYKGYVQNTNLLIGLFNDYVSGKKTYDYAYQALKRRFGWEFDGMRLHEYYFENLGEKKPLESSVSLSQMLIRDFGSYDDWKKDFVATGLMRGIGWAILYYDPEAKRLFNTWINEHDLGHLATGSPILVMDVWEHAYMPQFGLDRGKYIQAFFNNIDWSVAQTRLHNALIGRN